MVEIGGKQYRVGPGEMIDVERLDLPVGATFETDKVLLVSDGERVLVGNPTVEGAKVVAKVVLHGRGPKIRVFKYKPKKRYRRTKGHRQNFTRLKIESIEIPPQE